MKPMLCDKTTKEQIDSFNDNWKAQIKWDGERIMAIKKDGGILLMNRRGRIKNSFYLEIAEELNKIDGEFILDGEIISLDDDFNKLQRRALTSNPSKQEQVRKEIPVKYMVFDIIQIETDIFPSLALKDRAVVLKSFFNCNTNLKNIELVEYGEIKEMLTKAEVENREGIIIKNMESSYEQKRSKNWLKLKFFKNTELTLTTYTENNAGIRAEDKDLNVVQISGEQHKEVKKEIDEVGYCEVTIQYLEQSETTKRFRFPSFIGVKK